jgi:hypothetical protein
MEIRNLDYDNARNGHYLKISKTGSSKAIDLRYYSQKKLTVMLSAINGGTAKVMYSLDRYKQVEDDSALWFNWSKGDLSLQGGAVFDSPVNFIRVVPSIETVRYILQILV